VKRTVVFMIALTAASAVAAPFVLSGQARSDRPLPASTRVGLFALDRNGKPTVEIGRAQPGQDGQFTLSVPDTAPPAAAISVVAAESLDWPGLVGSVTIESGARAAITGLRAYTDADSSGTFTAGDSVWDTTVTRGRTGGVIILWAPARFRVSAEKGFDYTFSPGWNVVVVEGSRNVKLTPTDRAGDLQLDVFRR
jgi:hypothetical protein